MQVTSKGKLIPQLGDKQLLRIKDRTRKTLETLDIDALHKTINELYKIESKLVVKTMVRYEDNGDKQMHFSDFWKT